MRPDPVLSMLSLAQKAGKLRAGSFMAEKSVKSGHSKLVIISQDASANTKKKFRDACAFRHVDIFEYADSAALGGCTGREARVVISVEDEGFAESVKKRLAEVSSI